ncbi:hypothetical protein GCM10023116_13230 [Kistimonas scapharcae]|uniref:Uncharacterized protein n=1 Tax=Kistimonas scapharcae TaxID=1036133 RepID=A0ABP8V0R2_9GAMM
MNAEKKENTYKSALTIDQLMMVEKGLFILKNYLEDSVKRCKEIGLDSFRETHEKELKVVNHLLKNKFEIWM